MASVRLGSPSNLSRSMCKALIRSGLTFRPVSLPPSSSTERIFGPTFAVTDPNRSPTRGFRKQECQPRGRRNQQPHWLCPVSAVVRDEPDQLRGIGRTVVLMTNRQSGGNQMGRESTGRWLFPVKSIAATAPSGASRLPRFLSKSDSAPHRNTPRRSFPAAGPPTRCGSPCSARPTGLA